MPESVELTDDPIYAVMDRLRWREGQQNSFASEHDARKDIDIIDMDTVKIDVMRTASAPERRAHAKSGAGTGYTGRRRMRHTQKKLSSY